MPEHLTENTPFASGAALKKPTGRSGFGKQASSRKTTAPNFSLGHESRDQASKVFISSAHVNVEKRCLGTPGAIYSVPSSIDKQVSALKQTAPQYSFSKTEKMKGWESSVPGPGTYRKPSALGEQPDSSKMTQPKYRFGSTTRDQQSKVFLTSTHVKEQMGTMGAAPGSYAPAEALGNQASSLRRSSPSFSMPRTDRLKDDYEKMRRSLPAVGQYETWGSIGKQSLSGSKTLPAYAFGSSSWDKEEKRFLTVGHANRTLLGTSTSNYDHQRDNNFSSIGRQSTSHRENSATHKFGTGPKMIFKTNDTPGPGAYD